MLPIARRLRTNRQFRLVYSRGRSFVHPMLVLYIRRSGGRGPRIGFSISKKIGGAVERNRIRRRLREICRARIERLNPDFDLVFVARKLLENEPFHSLERVVDELFGQARLWTDPPVPEISSCGKQPLA